MDANKYKTHLTIFGALVAIYGIFGWLDVSNYAQGGWNTDRNNMVTQVLSGSPAEAAGLMAGDQLISLGGIAMSDASAQSRRNRPAIGETWEFVIERDGQEMSLDVTFGEPVPQRKLLSHAGFLVGFCFLVFTLRAYLQRQTPSTAALALAGILFSFVFITGPYFGSFTLRSLANAIETLLVFLGIPSILYFLLVHFGSGYLGKANAKRMLYAPGLLAGLFLAWRILATPEATDSLNLFSSVFIGAVALFYLITSLVTVYKNYSASSSAERDSKGLNLMLLGTLIGMLPPVVTIVTGIIAPQLVLPGQAFYFLSFVLIPITWSIAASKSASAA